MIFGFKIDGGTIEQKCSYSFFWKAKELWDSGWYVSLLLSLLSWLFWFLLNCYCYFYRCYYYYYYHYYQYFDIMLHPFLNIMTIFLSSLVTAVGTSETYGRCRWSLPGVSTWETWGFHPKPWWLHVFQPRTRFLPLEMRMGTVNWLGYKPLRSTMEEWDVTSNYNLGNVVVGFHGGIEQSCSLYGLKFLHFFPRRSWKYACTFQNLTSASAPDPALIICTGTWPNLCTGPFRNLTSASAPEPSGTSPRYLHRNPPEHHQTSVPEPSGTWPAYVHRNLPEPDLTFRNLTSASAPVPSGTSLSYLHRNPPEPDLTSVLEPSGFEPDLGMYTGTLRNLT